jgi:hypothetical protein
MFKRNATHVKLNPIGVTYKGPYNNYATNAYFGNPVILNKKNIVSVERGSFNGKMGTFVNISDQGNPVAYFVKETTEYFEKLLT